MSGVNENYSDFLGLHGAAVGILPATTVSSDRSPPLTDAVADMTQPVPTTFQPWIIVTACTTGDPVHLCIALAIEGKWAIS